MVFIVHIVVYCVGHCDLETHAICHSIHFDGNAWKIANVLRRSYLCETISLQIIALIKCRWQFVKIIFGRLSNFKWTFALSLCSLCVCMFNIKMTRKRNDTKHGRMAVCSWQDKHAYSCHCNTVLKSLEASLFHYFTSESHVLLPLFGQRKSLHGRNNIRPKMLRGRLEWEMKKRKKSFHFNIRNISLNYCRMIEFEWPVKPLCIITKRAQNCGSNTPIMSE